LRSESRNEKVPEPVACCRAGLRQSSDGGVEDFGIDNPWRAIPGRTVEYRPDVEKCHGGDAAGGEGG